MNFTGPHFAATFGIIIALGAGCLGEDPLENVNELGPTFEEFEAETIRDDFGNYIVDGDIPLLNVEELREFYETYVRPGKLAVRRSGLNGSVDVKWDDVEKKNLTYCVSTTFETRHGQVVEAMATATSEWESVADVDFTHHGDEDSNCTSSNTNVVFNVVQTDSQAVYAAAFFPNFHRGARNFAISSLLFASDTRPFTLTGILRHEVGHTLGFPHEHARPEAGNCSEGYPFRALTPYDSSSVMHYPFYCNGTQTGDLVLTELDKAGAAALYGSP